MNRNFFKRREMLRFFRSLPVGDRLESRVIRSPQRIAIVTHDDEFDDEMHDYGVKHGCSPTFFILHHRAPKRFPKDACIGFHYNKDSRYTLREQLDRFSDRTGFRPHLNRNHRLWWRATHLDLAHLAMNGFSLDSTLCGVAPYRYVVQQRELPIWELPFSICDPPAVSVSRMTTCTVNLADDMSTLFQQAKSPIVAIFHPYLKKKTNWKYFYALTSRYRYRLMNVQQFYETYLKDA